nr:NADH dehydrogenase subunit 6 [Paraulopus oblongus]
MTSMLVIALIGLVVGMIVVASNPSPYFAAFGLVLAAAFGCMALASCEGSFLSLILFLIYLGGMLVVFAYSAALAAEPYPETLGDSSIVGRILVYTGVVTALALIFLGGWYGGAIILGDGVQEIEVRVAGEGAAMVYADGGALLLVCGSALLLTLFVVLEVVRGHCRWAMRVP